MKTLTALSGAIALSFSSAAFATNADIVFVVDESSGVPRNATVDLYQWIDDVALSLDAELISRGTTGNRFALVGFANDTDGSPIGISDTGRGNNTWLNSTDFTTATDFLIDNGDVEDGYQAIDFFFDNYSSADANSNLAVILITDEDRDVVDAGVDFSSILGLFGPGNGWANSYLNVVVDAALEDDATNIASAWRDGTAYTPDGSGGVNETPSNLNIASAFGSTTTDYIDLAVQTGGGVVDIFPLVDEIPDEIDSAAAALVDIKADETATAVTTSVPTPSALALSLLGLLALRRRFA